MVLKIKEKMGKKSIKDACIECEVTLKLFLHEIQQLITLSNAFM